MDIATAIVSVILSSLLVYSAVRKLSHAPAVVASYARAGVPERMLNSLAMLLLAGAAGLVVGLWWRPLGVAAAAALVAYFILAIGSHVRASDASRVGTPAAHALLAGVCMVLFLAGD